MAMIKFAKRAIIISLISITAFITVSLTTGGEPFRWVGDMFRKGTYEFSDTADMINKSSKAIKKSASTTGEIIRETGEKISDTSGKAVDAVKSSGESLKNTAGGIGEKTIKAKDRLITGLDRVKDSITGKDEAGDK